MSERTLQPETVTINKDDAWFLFDVAFGQGKSAHYQHNADGVRARLKAALEPGEDDGDGK